MAMLVDPYNATFHPQSHHAADGQLTMTLPPPFDDPLFFQRSDAAVFVVESSANRMLLAYKTGGSAFFGCSGNLQLVWAAIAWLLFRFGIAALVSGLFWLMIVYGITATTDSVGYNISYMVIGFLAMGFGALVPATLRFETEQLLCFDAATNRLIMFERDVRFGRWRNTFFRRQIRLVPADADDTPRAGPTVHDHYDLTQIDANSVNISQLRPRRGPTIHKLLLGAHIFLTSSNFRGAKDIAEIRARIREWLLQARRAQTGAQPRVQPQAWSSAATRPLMVDRATQTDANDEKEVTASVASVDLAIVSFHDDSQTDAIRLARG